MNRQVWTIKKYQVIISELKRQINLKEQENKSLKEQISELNQMHQDSSESGNKKVTESVLPMAAEIKSGEFWENLYKNGGTSGRGSYNRLAEFKALVVNDFVQQHNIENVVELGCGDGNQLEYMNYPHYVGVDVSSYIIKQNQEKFISDTTKQFFDRNDRKSYMSSIFDLSISLDVIFHLIEEEVYIQYMKDLFALSNKYVIIYSSNHEAYTPWPEFRHRNFMNFVQKNEFEEWELYKYIPNKYPYLIGYEEDTSCSDFYIFKKK